MRRISSSSLRFPLVMYGKYTPCGEAALSLNCTTSCFVFRDNLLAWQPKSKLTHAGKIERSVSGDPPRHCEGEIATVTIPKNKVRKACQR